MERILMAKRLTENCALNEWKKEGKEIIISKLGRKKDEIKVTTFSLYSYVFLKRRTNKTRLFLQGLSEYDTLFLYYVCLYCFAQVKKLERSKDGRMEWTKNIGSNGSWMIHSTLYFSLVYNSRTRTQVTRNFPWWYQITKLFFFSYSQLSVVLVSFLTCDFPYLLSYFSVQYT